MKAEEFHQLMTERLQMLTEALERAENGNATPEDWAIIRYECGLQRKENAYSASKQQ